MESAIAAELWRWALHPREARAELMPNLSVALEFYLRGAFHLIEFTRSRGIWCDGILELSVRQINRRTFVLAGVAYSPNNLAPVEVEFHFARRRDTESVRTLIRFGEHDPVHKIRWHTNAIHAARIVANRPRRDRDWAVAVELTPIEA